MTRDLAERYGAWAVVAGGSDGIGASFANEIAARGMNVVIVARRVPVLEAMAEELRSRHDVEVRTVALDLGTSDAVAKPAQETADLEVGLFVYNGRVAWPRGRRARAGARRDGHSVVSPGAKGTPVASRQSRRPGPRRPDGARPSARRADVDLGERRPHGRFALRVAKPSRSGAGDERGWRDELKERGGALLIFPQRRLQASR